MFNSKKKPSFHWRKPEPKPKRAKTGMIVVGLTSATAVLMTKLRKSKS